MKNWKTTWSGISGNLLFTMGIVALIPYNMPPELSDFLPPKVKAWVMIVGLGSGCVLKCIQAFQQSDKK